MTHTAGEDDATFETSAEESAGTGDTTASFQEVPDQATIDEIEAERRRRLDPENRPPNAEVDNSDRHFNAETGHFED